MVNWNLCGILHTTGNHCAKLNPLYQYMEDEYVLQAIWQILRIFDLCASVDMCFVFTCWERADIFALVCGVLLWVCYFPIGVQGQVWYLIVSIPDLCTLTYFLTIAMYHHAEAL